MAEMSVIAHPYAEALFKLAKQNHNESDWLETLSKLQQIVLNKDFSAILNNPKIDGEQVISITKTLLNDEMSEEVLNLLKVLITNNRVLALAEIYHVFRALVLEDQKRGDAVIESAYPMSHEELHNFEQLLSRKFGKDITAKVVVVPDLMGGIKITVNDKVIDGSIKGRLNNLATQLTK